AAVADWSVPPHVLMTVGGNELLKSAVMRGLGLGCIATSAVAAEVRRGELVTVPLKRGSIETTLSIVQRANYRPSAIVQKFLDLCLAARVPGSVDADRRPRGSSPPASGSAEPGSDWRGGRRMGSRVGPRSRSDRPGADPIVGSSVVCR